jgi:hypothetical protein
MAGLPLFEFCGHCRQFDDARLYASRPKYK